MAINIVRNPRGVGAFEMIPCLGVLGVFAGIGLLFYDSSKLDNFGLGIAALGLVLVLAGMLLGARKEREGWEIIVGRCVERELEKCPGLEGGWTWVWRLVCEYEYRGAKYRVTPVVNWITFGTERAARKFLDGKISLNGECKLRINPRKPLQTELFGQGIKDKLLY